MSILRLVQVGVRGMGDHWVGVTQRSAEVEVVGYVDTVPAHLEALQHEHGVAASTCYGDLDTALLAVRPDAVLCVVPPQFHHAVAVQALRAGCHVLTEKPLADTWDRCLNLAAQARRAGRVLMVAQNYRYSSPVQTLRRVVQAAGLGVPGQVSVEFYKGRHFGGFREAMPYPLVVDMCIHHFDLLRYVLGADPVTVYARSWNPPWSWYKGDASTTALFQMREAGGAIVEVTYTGSFCANGGVTPWNGDWRVLCADGAALLQDDRVYVQRPDGRTREEVAQDPLSLTGQDHLLHEFVTAVREGREPETSVEDNLRSMEMVFKTVGSIELGGVVEVGGRPPTMP